MTIAAWNAYYYDNVDNSHAPGRSELIEADSVEEAARIARSHMGKYVRVDIARPRWEFGETRVILAGEALHPERDTRH